MLNLMARLKVSVAGHVFYFSFFLLPTYCCVFIVFSARCKSYFELIPHRRVYAEVYQPDILDTTLTWGTVIYITLPLTLCKSLTFCYISRLTTALNILCIFPHTSCYDLSEK